MKMLTNKNQIKIVAQIIFFVSLLTSSSLVFGQEIKVSSSIVIAAPTENQNFINQKEIVLEAKTFGSQAKKVVLKVFQQDKEIASLEANVGGENIWNKVLDITNYDAGDYLVVAQANIEDNQTVTSPAIKFKITIDQPLILEFVNLGEKQLSSPVKFQIKSSGKIQYINLFLENDLIKKNLGFAAYNKENDSWELIYDSTKVEDGLYTLIAEGYTDNKYHQINRNIEVNNNNREIFSEKLPSECLISGIVSNKACQRFLFANQKINCEETGVSKDLCAEVGQVANLPDECRLENITDFTSCQKFIVSLYAPAECRNTNTLLACQELLRKKYIDPKCQDKNITEKNDCNDYLIQKYQNTFSCPNLDQTTCQRTVRERHLPFLINIIDHLENLQNVLKDFSSITTSRVKIVPSSVKIILDENDQLIYSPPMVLVIDSDGDGLPDSSESRLGTDPNRHDTDRDGFNDLRETKDSLSKLQEIGINMSNLDNIVFNEGKIEQPITSKNYSSLIEIQEIKNQKSNLVFSGQSFPDSYVTLFIYSDIALVTDIKTNQDGYFEVAIKQVLPDGHHQVYATIINDQGEILARSDEYNFFIKNGQVTSQSFVEKILPTNKNHIIIYIIIFVVIIGLGLIIKKSTLKKGKKYTKINRT